MTGCRQCLLPQLIAQQVRNPAGSAEHGGALLCDQDALQERTTAGCLAATVSLHAGQQDEPVGHLLSHVNALQARTTGSAVTVCLHTAQQHEPLRRLLSHVNALQTRATAGSAATVSLQSAGQTEHRRHGLGRQIALERKELDEAAANDRGVTSRSARRETTQDCDCTGRLQASDTRALTHSELTS